MVVQNTIDLPLHTGKAPQWLMKKMVSLSKEFCNIYVHEFGTTSLIEKIADPFWFQAYSCLIGFDWHSSGTTTATCGALKRALNTSDIGINVCGGKGKNALRTPEEIMIVCDKYNLKEDKFIRASRLTAKCDAALLQDGFDLYHHCFFLTETGSWCVVQQGLMPSSKYARRYHWTKDSYRLLWDKEPHSGFFTKKIISNCLNMLSERCAEARNYSVEIAIDLANKKRLPRHHHVLLSEQSIKKLNQIMTFEPQTYEELVLIKGFGKAHIRALALLANLIYGTKLDWEDPAIYSYAHGGKDGHPFPILKDVYDNTIEYMKEISKNLGLSSNEKLKTLRNLDTLLKTRKTLEMF